MSSHHSRIRHHNYTRPDSRLHIALQLWSYQPLPPTNKLTYYYNSGPDRSDCIYIYCIRLQVREAVKVLWLLITKFRKKNHYFWMNKTILGLVIDLRHSRITLSDSLKANRYQTSNNNCTILALLYPTNTEKNFANYFWSRLKTCNCNWILCWSWE